MTSDRQNPEIGDVLSSDWVRDRHAFEGGTQSRLQELEATVAELKRLV
jgi:hypothetical protein